MTERLIGIGPAAYVRDLAASRRFYEGLLGLEVRSVMRRAEREIAVAYAAGLSVWQIDDACDMIFGAGSPRLERLGCGNWEFSFETPDLDALAARLEAAGVRFAQPLCTMAWGQRAMRVHDPDGHIVDIGALHRVSG